MDPIQFWKETIENFDAIEKCGFCWKFYAPLTEVNLNLVDTEGDCCVHVFLTWDRGNDFETRANWSDQMGININPSIIYNYNVYFLVKSPEGINNYNEKSDHPISESRYETIFRPLRECINLSIFDKICMDFGITNFSGRNIYDYQDEMFYGINLSVSTQKRL